ncbi:uncharacterized protein N7518_009989 [Penicillium psychrosexuale]|uniref:uncharacterized protein n=1 Tax=Penicillium psychrosexuale TaxID=1002107 RepID=UPI0025453070|nr:uncharacterized protein N7518_009989 [Penicillium psychrosexuale]KAJ5781506.1 hypothetical protein N7518_009989 [Penicillium psychrosexuale]
METIKAFLEPHTELGESPLFRKSDNTLHYIDVLGYAIHVLDLSCIPYSSRTINLPEAVASMNFCRQGGYILCTFNSLAMLGDDGSWTELVKVIKGDDRKTTRLNDSAVDCMGRLWFGSLDIWLDGSDAKRPEIPQGYVPTGGLYRYDPDQTLHIIQHGGVVCSNGIGWTSDHKVMFHTDSFRQIIWAYDFDSTTAEIKNQRVHIDRRGQTGEPDGLIVDDDWNVFTFIWNGSVVEKYNPRGQFIQKWELNAFRVTHGAWVGQDMNEIIVTSARNDGRKGDPLNEGGGLFWLKNVTASQGMPKGKFDLSF